MSEAADEFEVADPVDTGSWDDAMFLRSEALLAYELEQEDPDTYPAGPDYQR